MIDELFLRIANLEANMSEGKDSALEEKGSCSVKLSKLSKCQLKDDEDEFDDVTFVDKLHALEGKSISLMLDSSNVIAAYGIVVGFHGENKVIHGCPMPKNCARVSIDEAVKPNALLPYPILECVTVGDAVGSYVAWPIHLMTAKEKTPMKKKVKGKQVVKNRLITTYDSLNSSLKALYCYVEGAMKNGKGIYMALDDDVFGTPCEIYMHLEDIIPFCELDPISGNCIIVYIWHLYKQMKKESTLNKFRFVNPIDISYMNKNGIDNRTQVLAERLEGVSPNQLVFVPCNVGYHWILTVIDPHKEVVYLLDSLYHRIRDESWKNVVDMAIIVFNATLGRKRKKHPSWEIIKCPIQPDSKQCGFYVMRFMKEIIEGLTKSGSNSIKSMFKKDKYSEDVEIDEVRKEWANCVLEYI